MYFIAHTLFVVDVASNIKMVFSLRVFLFRNNDFSLEVVYHLEWLFHIFFLVTYCAGNACHLFAFPSECNFSGVRFNLDLVRAIKEQSGEIFKDTILTKYGNLLAYQLWHVLYCCFHLI